MIDEDSISKIDFTKPRNKAAFFYFASLVLSAVFGMAFYRMLSLDILNHATFTQTVMVLLSLLLTLVCLGFSIMRYLANLKIIIGRQDQGTPRQNG